MTLALVHMTILLTKPDVYVYTSCMLSYPTCDWLYAATRGRTRRMDRGRGSLPGVGRRVPGSLPSSGPAEVPLSFLGAGRSLYLIRPRGPRTPRIADATSSGGPARGSRSTVDSQHARASVSARSNSFGLESRADFSKTCTPTSRGDPKGAERETGSGTCLLTKDTFGCLTDDAENIGITPVL